MFAVLVLLMQKIIKRLSTVMLCNFEEKIKKKIEGKGRGGNDQCYNAAYDIIIRMDKSNVFIYFTSCRSGL